MPSKETQACSGGTMLWFSTALLSCRWLLKHFANSTFGARWDVTTPRGCWGGQRCPRCNNLTWSSGWDLLHPASPLESSMVSFMAVSNQELVFQSCFKVSSRPCNNRLIWFSRDWTGARSWSRAGRNQQSSWLPVALLFPVHVLLMATGVLVGTCQVFC